MFVQLVVLGLGNRAGEGYLSAERREWVYYALQIFVILGFLAYAAADHFLRGERSRRGVLCAVLAVFAAGTAAMLFAGTDSLFYVVITYAVMPCLGYLGGAVYHRMSLETAAGEKTARSMGFGCAAAVALQFFLQLLWGVTPLLPVALLGALLLLAHSMLQTPPETRPAETETATHRELLFACLIAVTFVLFTSFYNGYIHHLQIKTGYTDYNVYSWPRLLLIPCYLLFAAIGDLRQGKLVPIAALCIALVAMLNSVLQGAYWLNMCLYYCAIAAFVSYYNLTFWHLAQRTKHPALWASVGRIVDSGIVLLAGGLHISSLSAAAVLALNIGGLAVTIVLLSVSGAFNLAAAPDAPQVPAILPEDDAFERMREKYALTPRETEVLRELVLTEDKQTVICERLSIQVKALQKYVTQLYRKTGAATRSGLTELYHNTRIGL